MSKANAIVEPDGVADDIGWESVSFVVAHEPILLEPTR